jgi:hypothetical protein
LSAEQISRVLGGAVDCFSFLFSLLHPFHGRLYDHSEEEMLGFWMDLLEGDCSAPEGMQLFGKYIMRSIGSFEFKYEMKSSETVGIFEQNDRS